VELLAQLERIVEATCRRLSEPVRSAQLDAMLAELAGVFDAMTAQLPVAPPIQRIGTLRKLLTDAEPFELRGRVQKYVRGAKRERNWGEIVDRFVTRLDQLRYDLGASRNTRACDCLVLVEMASISRKPRSSRLRGIGWDHDGYYNGDAFACDECGTRWLNCSEDTESQHIEWWEPRDPAWEPARP
jgi:hypothetical protein